MNLHLFINKSSSGASIKTRIVEIVSQLCKRIIAEQDILVGTNIKSNYIINQWWNVLRSIWETPEYIPELLEPIEEELKPVFEYALKPDQIDFDDDIALLISTWIKLNQGLTETQKLCSNVLKEFIVNIMEFLEIY